LHLQAAGDPVVPADLARWFTERACHFYLAGLRLPARTGPLRSSGRAAERAFAELDVVRRHLREADGIEHMIVSAQGPAAVAAAMWCDRQSHNGRLAGGAPAQQQVADALILYRPAWPSGRALRLDIACPVLVLTAARRESRWGLRRSAVPRHLAGRVTWLRLPGAGAAAGLADVAGSTARRAFFDELGRWLGAYMYGPPPDPLV
jgi:hypothetical protein